MLPRIPGPHRSRRTYASLLGRTNAVANTDLAQMATLTIKGNNTAGTANASDLTIANVLAMLAPSRYNLKLTAVNFNSANSDNSLTITLPTGCTRYLIAAIRITNASASVSTATCGVFTAAAAGGTAYVASGTVITVTTASVNSDNNVQSLTIVNNANSIRAIDVSPLFFRVQTAQGSAATADVDFEILPLP